MPAPRPVPRSSKSAVGSLARRGGRNGDPRIHGYANASPVQHRLLHKNKLHTALHIDSPWSAVGLPCSEQSSTSSASTSFPKMGRFECKSTCTSTDQETASLASPLTRTRTSTRLSLNASVPCPCHLTSDLGGCSCPYRHQKRDAVRDAGIHL